MKVLLIYTTLYKYGKNTRNFWKRYYLYLTIVGYEMINELGATHLVGFLPSHVIPTRAYGVNNRPCSIYQSSTWYGGFQDNLL